MNAPPRPASAWAAIYDRQRCIGHILHRAKKGWEAFNADDESIGLFKSPAEAANALEST